MPQAGFFNIDRRLESTSPIGDPLERLAAEIARRSVSAAV